MSGDPKFQGSQDLPDFKYADYADSLGLRGILVKEPGRVAQAWKMALSADRPVVIDAITDPNVPPLPPHITFDQAKKYMSALIKGDPDRAGIVRQSFRQALDALIPSFRK